MTETTETAAPKLPDVTKQKLFVQNKRRVTLKRVKRGIRTRLERMEQTFVQMLVEIRGALTFVQRKHEEQDTLLAILAKHAMGKDLRVDDLAILDEHIEKNEPPAEEPAKEAPVAGAGDQADQGG